MAPLPAIQIPAGLNLLSIFAIVFVIILVLFWLNNFFIIYHLIRFGIGKLPKQLSLFTMIGSSVLSLLALIVFLGIYL